MKTIALLTAALLLGANSDPAIPQGQLIKSVNWENAHFYSDDRLQVKATYSKVPDNGKIELTVTHIKTQSTGSMLEGIYPLVDFYPIDLEKLTAGSYAILGEVKAEKDATGSNVIVMWKNTENDNLPTVRALDATGDTLDLKPSEAWQPFWIPFDTKTARPIRLGVKLYLYGAGTFHFRNIRLVQYPDAPAEPAPPAPAAPAPTPTAPASMPVAAASSPVPSGLDQAALATAYLKAQSDLAAMEASKAGWLASGYTEGHPRVVALNAQIAQQQGLLDTLQAEIKAQQSSSLDWRSFLLGVAATGLTLLAVTGVIFISRNWQRRHHERELRRIASLDS